MLYEYRQCNCVQKHTWYLYDIVEDVKTRFKPSKYKLNRPLQKGKSKKVISVMKDELSGKIMKEFVGFKTKTYSYPIDGGTED